MKHFYFHKGIQLSFVNLLLIVCSPVFSQDIHLTNLRCGNRNSPIGVNDSSPAFSWQVISQKNRYLQLAYQLKVADNIQVIKKEIGNIWNSGIIKTEQSNLIEYAGKKLLPACKYYWTVQVWDQKKESCKSTIDSFTTGLFDSKDWSNAKWIGYEELPVSMQLIPGVHAPQVPLLGNKAIQRSVVPLFRKEFSVKKKIINATAFISGLGQYELRINGKKTGDDFLTPGWSNYEKKVYYNTYDVTSQLINGKNTLGVIVGNGFYNINRERYFKLVIAYGLPKMICKLKIDYEDGSSSTIVSDETWKTTPSPITYSSIYGGEDYDAQLEQPGWDQSEFNDMDWKNAILVNVPKGSLESESIYPVKIKESFTPKKVIQPRKDIFVYDFGQNASAIIEVKVKGKKGQVIKFTPSELLTDDLLANQKATGEPYCFTYTLKGDSVETWRPLFTYYGFRYVQVEGAVPDTANSWNLLPKIISLRELHNSSSAPEVGTFQCSNQLFNRINSLIKWAIQSNVQSVVTDCPHREKLSWLEQDYLMGNSIHDNLDIYQLYTKLVYDMMDAQTPDGLVPDIAPEFVTFDGGFRDSPEWGSAAVILPWLLYTWYGSTDIIRTAFPMMKKYVAYLEGKSNHHILSYGLGDWFDYGPKSPGKAQLTPKELTATAIYYYDVMLLGKMAALVGTQKDVDSFRHQAIAIKKAFNKRFFHPQTKIYATGSQTAMAMPLCVGLVEEGDKVAVFGNLVDSINLSGKKLTAGDVGYHFLVEALYAGGASQLLYDMNCRDDVPGYGFQLKKGATALTESWPALAEVSNNHLMLGHLMEWFYTGIAGISQAANSVAYKDIIIRPEIVGDLTYAKGTYQSPYGMIVSEWKKQKNSFELLVSIPANTTATVFLPATTHATIRVNGQVIRESKEVQLSGIKEGRAILKLGSGNYTFLVGYKPEQIQ